MPRRASRHAVPTQSGQFAPAQSSGRPLAPLHRPLRRPQRTHPAKTALWGLVGGRIRSHARASRSTCRPWPNWGPQRQPARYTGTMQSLPLRRQRSTPTPDTARSTTSRPRAGRMAGASSSSWARLGKMPMPSRRYGASTSRSRSSATSTVRHRINACVSGASDRGRSSRISNAGSGASGASFLEEPAGQGRRLQPQALEHVHALPRRRPHLHDRQRGRARRRRRQAQLDLLRLRRRR